MKKNFDFTQKILKLPIKLNVVSEIKLSGNLYRNISILISSALKKKPQSPQRKNFHFDLVFLSIQSSPTQANMLIMWQVIEYAFGK